MVVVAVVGGTGSVGKTIVEAIQENGNHEVIVLTRKAPEGKGSVPTFAVDYNNVEQVIETLNANNVHTVISTIVMYGPIAAQSERNVIAAAAKSTSTKRFIASNWGFSTPKDESLRLDINGFRDESLEALRKTDLEWTQVHNGFFLDYYGMPNFETHLTPFVFAVDVANHTAAIPGTGDEILTFTSAKDVGKFVVAALGLPKWDEALYCYSENASFNRLVQLAEKATGKKFKVEYDSIEKLKGGEVTELPSHSFIYPFFPKPALQFLLSRFGLWVANDLMRASEAGSLNEKFPEIATTSVEKVVGALKGN